MEEQYIYTQLDTSKPGSFRILELQPGEKQAPIVCNLIHARLDVRPRWRRPKFWKRPPAYEAISYVWGSSEKPIPINCGGKRLYITENLKHALVRVRLPDRPRNVWADSICIDQDNLEEKGHQVQFMGEIYSNASRVLICLGEDNKGHAQKAMSLINDAGNMIAKTLTKCKQKYGSFPFLAPDDPWLQDDRWPAYDYLLSRPWFRRGWVLQEAALAQDAVILWGEAECGWVSLMDTGIWFTQRGQALSDQVDPPPAIHTLLHLGFGSSRKRLRPFLDEEMEAENLRVLSMMAAARELNLTNPADRVYAFLSIVDEIGQKALHIKADYSTTPQSVYTDFAVAYLEATNDLDLLKYVQHTNESLELSTPSWVPLWNINEWEIQEGSEDDGLKRKQGSRAHFTLEQGSGTPRLTVQAVLFDTVRFASDPLLLETVKDVAQLWQIIRHVDESADVYEFLQVITWGSTTGEWETWKLQLFAYGQHLLASSSSSNLDGDFPLVQSFIQLITKGRKLVLTEKKGYYGLVPGVAKQGDICAFLPGTELPFALRQTENMQEYKILGDADFSTHHILYRYGEGEGIPWYDFNVANLVAKRSCEELTIALI